MNKIQKNDEVIVLVGKNKGRRGVVKDRVGGGYLLIEGMAFQKKAVKPNPTAGIVGGIVNKLMPIHVSNVALFNSIATKGERVGFKEVDGKKVRVYKSSGEVVKV